MPNRIIREGINTSEKVNKLSWVEECFYRRLLNEVDDFGRFSAHPSLLLAACFPLKLDSITISDIEQWLNTLAEVRGSEKDTEGLILVYEVGGKKYLQVLNFKQKTRSKSKYPPPPENICTADDMQMHSKCSTNARLDVGVFEGEDGDVGEDGALKKSSASSSLHCQRNGKWVPAEKHGTYVVLTGDEYKRMIDDWGEKYTKAAITEYDMRFPNSKAIKNHSDHNRGIRDWVNRGFICQGKTKRPKSKQEQKPQKLKPEEIATPEDVGKANIFRTRPPPDRRDGKGMQPISEILEDMHV